MNSDVERYKLCLQCREEYVPFIDGLNESLNLGVIVEIKNAIKYNCKWRNEWYWQSCMDLRDGSICLECPYVLEHIVLGGRLNE